MFGSSRHSVVDREGKGGEGGGEVVGPVYGAEDR